MDQTKTGRLIRALRQGQNLTQAELGEKLTGDETRACQGIQLVSRTLTASLENLRKQQPEREKRGAALWFSGAALLIILLI